MTVRGMDASYSESGAVAAWPRRWFLWTWIFLLSASLVVASGTVRAQSSGENWHVSVLMGPVGDDESVWYPYAVADQSGKVHVFWTYKPAGSQYRTGEFIYYAFWDGASWSDPVDVLFTPQRRGAQMPQAVIDEKGTIHLMWTGVRQGVKHDIYYAKAHASNAGTFQAWTSPAVWRWDASIPYLLMDTQGTLHVVYVGEGANSGIYYTRSEDAGATWANPVQISPLGISDSFPQMAIDGRGRFHVVWAHDVNPGEMVFELLYSQSVDQEGQAWSPAVKVAGPGQIRDISVATIGDDEIHLVWQGSVQDHGRYHQWSPDGGATWTQVTTILDLDGRPGSPSLVLDSARRLHLATSGLGYGNIHGVYHTTWAKSRWAEYEMIPYPYHTEYADMTIATGNTLVVCAQAKVTDNVEGFNTIWCAIKRTSAPYVAPQPLPTAIPTAAPTMPVEATPTRGPQATATAGPRNPEVPGATSRGDGDGTTDPWVPVAMGVSSVLAVVGSVILTQVMRQHRW